MHSVYPIYLSTYLSIYAGEGDGIVIVIVIVKAGSVGCFFLFCLFAHTYNEDKIN